MTCFSPDFEDLANLNWRRLVFHTNRQVVDRDWVEFIVMVGQQFGEDQGMQVNRTVVGKRGPCEEGSGGNHSEHWVHKKQIEL